MYTERCNSCQKVWWDWDINVPTRTFFFISYLTHCLCSALTLFINLLGGGKYESYCTPLYIQIPLVHGDKNSSTVTPSLNQFTNLSLSLLRARICDSQKSEQCVSDPAIKSSSLLKTAWHKEAMGGMSHHKGLGIQRTYFLCPSRGFGRKKFCSLVPSCLLSCMITDKP